ncbi:unnamed protein product [Nesidiocoris tenuis]|uniref:Uncharacterized protein n=1 Tax=Nesidiocoris tenuis TaxID=355587 RepID=A0A6H5GRF9_9HEMI|nr:unnamed protein product [Nesidiocoris tenuis]
MARFKDYYPKDVIADVYDQLQTAWSSKQPSADSDVDSERQSNSSEASTSLIRPSIAGRPVRKAISIAVQATENDWDNDDAPSPRNDSPPLFSKGEIQDLCHKDSAVKKRSNYIKEMYGILNTIQDTTSCSVCKKLKIRLDKFKNYLSSESLSIRKKVIQRRSKSNLESGHQRMQNIHEAKSPFPVLSVHKEQLVRDYLVKKVIEASMPEIVKMTEARMDPIPNQEMTNTNMEASTSVNGRKKSGKSKPEKAIGKAKRNSSDEVTAKSDSEVSDSEKQEKKKKKRKSEESWYWENGERSLEWDPEIDPLQAVDPLKIESDTFADSGDSDTRHSLKKKMKKSRESILWPEASRPAKMKDKQTGEALEKGREV